MQTEIISGIYNQINESLVQLEKNCKSFSLTENTECFVQFGIVDICQEMMDKSGQCLFVDEKEYKVPSFFDICFNITISGSDIKKVLDSYAKIAVHFKDNNTINIKEWNWHENPTDKIYIEPVIRPLKVDADVDYSDFIKMELRFRTGFALNSEHGREIKRVEQKIINSNVM